MPWIKYALPCAAVWLIYWLAFFPGLADPDALLFQWRQISGGFIMQAVPILNTILAWLVTRVWYSPAAIPLAQLLALAGVVGAALGRLERMGVPRAWLLGACSLCALSPVMGLVSITPWKDVAYGMAILWLTVQLARLVLSEGAALGGPARGTLRFSLAMIFVALLRPEGIALVLAVLLCVLVLYARHWIRLLAVLLVVLTVYYVASGPLLTLFGTKSYGAYPYQMALYQVSAAVAADTPVTVEERDVLEQIMPMKKWAASFDPTSWDPLYYGSGFDVRELDSHSSEFKRIWLSLTLRNPAAAINAVLSKGETVWSVPQSSWEWTVPDGVMANEVGITDDSRLPAARRFLMAVRQVTEATNVRWLFWRPALQLYLFLILSAVVAFKIRRASWLLVASPAAIHAAIMLILIPAQYFRYMFPVYLVAMVFCWQLILAVGTRGNTVVLAADPADGSPVPESGQEGPGRRGRRASSGSVARAGARAEHFQLVEQHQLGLVEVVRLDP
jgi:hypothetical protein